MKDEGGLTEGRVGGSAPAVAAGLRTRDERVDAARGICIVGMISWHLLSHPAFPAWIAFPVIQSMNFVAEGFVFLAGVASGIREVQRGRIAVAHHLNRAVRLLAVHYVVVVALVALFLWNGAIGRPPEYVGLGATAWSIVLLRYQPYLGDVLTVFVFLFALTPALLAVRRRLGDGALVAISAAVFLFSHLMYSAGGRAWQQRFELNTHGAFDVNTWQLVFVLGIVIGARWIANSRPDLPARWRWSVWLLLTLAFAALFAYRLGVKLQASWALGVPEMLAFNRHPLTLARLVYVGAEMLLVGMLIARFWPVLRDWRLTRLLVLFGRHSLNLFVASIFLDYLLKALLTTSQAGTALALGSWLLEIAVLAGLAYLYEDSRGRMRGQPEVCGVRG